MNTTVIDYQVQADEHPSIVVPRNRFGSVVITSDRYFVIGRTLNGGRFTSEDTDWDTAVKYYNDYQDVVRFFGGGTVTMYENNTFDFTEITEKVVW